MKIAIVQFVSTHDVQINLERTRELVSEAAAQGASLVVLPEAAEMAFGGDLRLAAELSGSLWEPGLTATAAETGTTIVAGGFRKGDATHVRNTLLAVDPTGELAAYDKIHLYDAFGYCESDSVRAGHDLVSIIVNSTRIGLATCYDLRFPRQFIQQAATGASLNLLCASWGKGPGKKEQWELLVKARALDSTTFLVAAGQADPATKGAAPTGDPTGIGHSMVVSPTGEIMTELGESEEIRVVDIPVEAVEGARKALPVLENRVEGID